MKEKAELLNKQDLSGNINPVIDRQGLLVYPKSEDIYNKNQEEENIDPEDIYTKKESIEDTGAASLDIPGAELDDDQENIGSEDEENNYYSLGGDDHNDLEEDKEV
jgi:hypothetical protein